MKKIIVLNFLTREVFILNYDENIWEDPEDFISESELLDNVSHNNCQWMVVKDMKLIIE